MENPISAEELRLAQNKYINENLDEEFTTIMKRLKKSMTDYNTEIVVSDIKVHNIRKLENLGYKVLRHEGDFYDPSYYTISWK